jgi:hypothetical protein
VGFEYHNCIFLLSSSTFYDENLIFFAGKDNYSIQLFYRENYEDYRSFLTIIESLAEAIWGSSAYFDVIFYNVSFISDIFAVTVLYNSQQILVPISWDRRDNTFHHY